MRKVSKAKEREYIWKEHKKCQDNINREMGRMQFLMERMWSSLSEEGSDVNTEDKE